MSYFNRTQVQASDSGSIDAFGRWRVSEPETLLDSKLLHDSQPLIWDDQEVSGSGTTSVHQSNEASVLMGVSNVTAGRRIRQTFRRFNYEPGKSQIFLVTFVLGVPQTGITKRLGLLDDNNGLYLTQTPSGLKIGVRTSTSGSPVDTEVAQANWNLDKFDGTGPSGITLDLTKTQILLGDYEWLGVGRIRFGFVIDGLFFYCHQILNTNNCTLPYIASPNLPVRFEILNDGTGPVSTLRQICQSVMSEGGQQSLGVLHAIDNGASGPSLSTGSIYARLGIRLKSTALDSVVTFTRLEALATTVNDQFHWGLLLNPTVGGTPTWVPLTTTSIEWFNGVVGNTVTASGVVLASGYGATGVLTSLEGKNLATLGAAINGTSDIVVMAITPITNNISVQCALNWKELV